MSFFSFALSSSQNFSAPSSSSSSSSSSLPLTSNAFDQCTFDLADFSKEKSPDLKNDLEKYKTMVVELLEKQSEIAAIGLPLILQKELINWMHQPLTLSWSNPDSPKDISRYVSINYRIKFKLADLTSFLAEKAKVKLNLVGSFCYFWLISHPEYIKEVLSKIEFPKAEIEPFLKVFYSKFPTALPHDIDLKCNTLDLECFKMAIEEFFVSKLPLNIAQRPLFYAFLKNELEKRKVKHFDSYTPEDFKKLFIRLTAFEKRGEMSSGIKGQLASLRLKVDATPLSLKQSHYCAKSLFLEITAMGASPQQKLKQLFTNDFSIELPVDKELAKVNVINPIKALSTLLFHECEVEGEHTFTPYDWPRLLLAVLHGRTFTKKSDLLKFQSCILPNSGRAETAILRAFQHHLESEHNALLPLLLNAAVLLSDSFSEDEVNALAEKVLSLIKSLDKVILNQPPYFKEALTALKEKKVTLSCLAANFHLFSIALGVAAPPTEFAPDIKSDWTSHGGELSSCLKIGPFTFLSPVRHLSNQPPLSYYLPSDFEKILKTLIFLRTSFDVHEKQTIEHLKNEGLSAKTLLDAAKNCPISSISYYFYFLAYSLDDTIDLEAMFAGILTDANLTNDEKGLLIEKFFSGSEKLSSPFEKLVESLTKENKPEHIALVIRLSQHPALNQSIRGAIALKLLKVQVDKDLSSALGTFKTHRRLQTFSAEQTATALVKLAHANDTLLRQTLHEFLDELNIGPLEAEKILADCRSTKKTFSALKVLMIRAWPEVYSVDEPLLENLIFDGKAGLDERSRFLRYLGVNVSLKKLASASFSQCLKLCIQSDNLALSKTATALISNQLLSSDDKKALCLVSFRQKGGVEALIYLQMALEKRWIDPATYFLKALPFLKGGDLETTQCLQNAANFIANQLPSSSSSSAKSSSSNSYQHLIGFLLPALKINSSNIVPIALQSVLLFKDCFSEDVLGDFYSKLIQATAKDLGLSLSQLAKINSYVYSPFIESAKVNNLRAILDLIATSAVFKHAGLVFDGMHEFSLQPSKDNLNIVCSGYSIDLSFLQPSDPTHSKKTPEALKAAYKNISNAALSTDNLEPFYHNFKDLLVTVDQLRALAKSVQNPVIAARLYIIASGLDPENKSLETAAIGMSANLNGISKDTAYVLKSHLMMIVRSSTRLNGLYFESLPNSNVSWQAQWIELLTSSSVLNHQKIAIKIFDKARWKTNRLTSLVFLHKPRLAFEKIKEMAFDSKLNEVLELLSRQISSMSNSANFDTYREIVNFAIEEVKSRPDQVDPNKLFSLIVQIHDAAFFNRPDQMLSNWLSTLRTSSRLSPENQLHLAQTIFSLWNPNLFKEGSDNRVYLKALFRALPYIEEQCWALALEIGLLEDADDNFSFVFEHFDRLESALFDKDAQEKRQTIGLIAQKLTADLLKSKGLKAASSFINQLANYHLEVLKQALCQCPNFWLDLFESSIQEQNHFLLPFFVDIEVANSDIEKKNALLVQASKQLIEDKRFQESAKVILSIKNNNELSIESLVFLISSLIEDNQLELAVSYLKASSSLFYPNQASFSIYLRLVNTLCHNESNLWLCLNLFESFDEVNSELWQLLVTSIVASVAFGDKEHSVLHKKNITYAFEIITNNPLLPNKTKVDLLKIFFSIDTRIQAQEVLQLIKKGFEIVPQDFEYTEKVLELTSLVFQKALTLLDNPEFSIDQNKLINAMAELRLNLQICFTDTRFAFYKFKIDMLVLVIFTMFDNDTQTKNAIFGLKDSFKALKILTSTKEEVAKKWSFLAPSLIYLPEGAPIPELPHEDEITQLMSSAHAVVNDSEIHECVKFLGNRLFEQHPKTIYFIRSELNDLWSNLSSVRLPLSLVTGFALHIMSKAFHRHGKTLLKKVMECGAAYYLQGGEITSEQRYILTNFTPPFIKIYSHCTTDDQREIIEQIFESRWFNELLSSVERAHIINLFYGAYFSLTSFTSKDSFYKGVDRLCKHMPLLTAHHFDFVQHTFDKAPAYFQGLVAAKFLLNDRFYENDPGITAYLLSIVPEKFFNGAIDELCLENENRKDLLFFAHLTSECIQKSINNSALAVSYRLEAYHNISALMANIKKFPQEQIARIYNLVHEYLETDHFYPLPGVTGNFRIARDDVYAIHLSILFKTGLIPISTSQEIALQFARRAIEHFNKYFEELTPGDESFFPCERILKSGFKIINQIFENYTSISETEKQPLQQTCLQLLTHAHFYVYFGKRRMIDYSHLSKAISFFRKIMPKNGFETPFFIEIAKVVRVIQHDLTKIETSLKAKQELVKVNREWEAVKVLQIQKNLPVQAAIKQGASSSSSSSTSRTSVAQPNRKNKMARRY